MAASISLTTDPTQEHAPLDVVQTANLIFAKGGRYGKSHIEKIVERVNHWCNIYLISPRVVMAQMIHETGWFKYGGDVQWWQFNFAGIGATGGVAGHAFTFWVVGKRPIWFATSFSPTMSSTNAKSHGANVTGDMIDWDQSIDLGVPVVVQHHAAYLYGPKLNWPHSAAHLEIVDPRYQLVVSKGAAFRVMSVKDYGGKWAVPGHNYGNMIVTIANALPVQENTMSVTVRPYVMKIPLRVSHVPWNNPNRSRQLSLPSGRGYITIHETGNKNVGANAEMHRRFVHNGGGPNNVLFNYVVDDKEAIELAPRGEKTWQASDGAMGPGNSSVSIEVCVNADGNWPKTLQNLYELVTYLLTNDSNLHTSRIVQHNHWAPDGKNCPTIMRGNNGQGWKAMLQAVGMMYQAQIEPPPSPRDPNALEVNGFWIITEMLHRWEGLKDNTLPLVGYPISGMDTFNIGGIQREAQIFERGVLAKYESGTPDGVPKDHPFYIRMLTLQEQDEVVAQAIERGIIEPFD